jgi:XTP/dITP diphosphohydrolase
MRTLPDSNLPDRSLPDRSAPDGTHIDQLVAVIGSLREHCPWMGALTHDSLVEYLLEEAFEVAETIETRAAEAELRDELGDVLLQVVLHARLAQERQVFDFDDVVRGLTGKMIRRNPHVFRPDGTLQDSFPATVEEIVQKWDTVKMAEKPARVGAFEGIPVALPALARAQKVLDRAERAGLGLPVPAKLTEQEPTQWLGEDALGELLLGLVVTARSRGLDAERALRGAIRRYEDAQQAQAGPRSSV